MRVLLLLLSLLLCQVALAGTPQTWEGRIDGVATWVTVVPQGHEISAAELRLPWWRWGNAATDAYIFAFRRQENVRLIFDFNYGQHPKLTLYARESDEAALSYTLTGDQLTVAAVPLLTLEPKKGGWFVGDKVNYNLTMMLDAHPDDPEPDGIMNYVFNIASTTPGVPDWSTQRMINDPTPSRGYPRFGVAMRMKGAPPFKVAVPIMPSFPHFGFTRNANNWDWFEENPQPLQFDLSKLALRTNSFVGFHHAGMYQINSVRLPPETDFESPFAFYNLVGDPNDRYADLVIRSVHLPANSPYKPVLGRGLDETSFRYSWKLFDNDFWAQGLSVAGIADYPDLLALGRSTYYGVPGTRLPEWIMNKPWPVVTFSEATQGYPGTEGLYFYSTQALPIRTWLRGGSFDEPDMFRAPFLPKSAARLGPAPEHMLPLGFRGEYNLAYKRKPELYFSPLDNRVHLKYASGGVWHLPNGYLLRSRNTAGGAYLDAWTLERFDPTSRPIRGEADVPLRNETGTQELQPKANPGTVEQALYALPGYLIYAGYAEGEDEIVVYRADYAPERFSLTPPQNRRTKELYLEQLAPYRGQARDPFELQSWPQAFAGSSTTLSGVTLEQVEHEDEGFRLVVRATAAVPETADLPALVAGLNVVTADAEGRLSSAPAQPARLGAELEVPETPLILQTSELTLTLHNTGDVDWQGNVGLRLDASPIKRWRDVTVPANGSLALNATWLPWQEPAGTFNAVAKGERFALGAVRAKPAPRVSEREAFILSIANIPASLYLIPLVLLLAFLGIWRAWRVQ